jgi:hypothetical protein
MAVPRCSGGPHGSWRGPHCWIRPLRHTLDDPRCYVIEAACTAEPKQRRQDRFPQPAAGALVRRAIDLAGKSEFLLPGSAAAGTIEAHRLTTAMARITKRLEIDDLNLHGGRSALRNWLRDEGVGVSYHCWIPFLATGANQSARDTNSGPRRTGALAFFESAYCFNLILQTVREARSCSLVRMGY